MRSLYTFVAIFLIGATPAFANSVAFKHIANAQQVGSGRLTFVFMDVYDATLYAPNGKWDARRPFALSIRYFREIDGAAIAKRSIEEMQKQGFRNKAKLARWYELMLEIFPDVQNGSELTAIYNPDKSTYFYANGQRIGAISDPEFATHFFNIWLSEKTSEPELRKKLLGLS